MKNIITAVLILSMFSFFSCNKDENDEYGPKDPICDDSRTPIVFIHGLLASGDTYANQFMRFSSNKYCENLMFAFDWNTLNQNADHETKLDLFIDEILDKTGADFVHLVGHSSGGNLSYSYLSDTQRALKVEKYVHIGSGERPGPAGANEEVPTMNIWSPDDKIVSSSNINGAENVVIPGKDHYEIATSFETFEAMFTFFNPDKTLETTGITPATKAAVSGKVVTLGENNPVNGATVSIYALNSNTGERTTEEPLFVINSQSDGKWGPVDLQPGIQHEFKVNTNIAGQRNFHYFRQGFERNNSLVYLRALPESGSILDLVLNDLPEDDNQSLLIVFLANQGLVYGRDNLKIDGYELATEEFADPDENVIALFLYDGNNNAQTDLTSQGLFGNFPFLESIDMYFQTQQKQFIECEFNNEILRVPNLKSESEGVVIVVFE